jgi:hypothetical protein
VDRDQFNQVETMAIFQPSSYGPVTESLLQPRRLMPLGPGEANQPLGSRLKALTIDELLAPRQVHDRNMGSACLAGLWLYHDFLDESHSLSQAIETPSGNYWHGILHRREPDYDNARYWFRRVKQHPVFSTLRQDVANLAGPVPEAASLTRGKEWDPFAFIDLCGSSLGSGSSLEMLCRQIQQREWEILFDYCYHRSFA